MNVIVMLQGLIKKCNLKADKLGAVMQFSK